MNSSKKAFICVDFEDWFHIPYLFKYNFDRKEYTSYADKTMPFFKWLESKGIPANIFVVADIANQNKPLIDKLNKMGNEIGCHSLHHYAVNKMTNEEFKSDTLEAKKIIESILKKKISGYRAPYFSMTDEKLMILKELGFSYDSSFIKSSANEYYSSMKLDCFNKIDSIIYQYDNFKEYEIPTLKGKPIAGGGFFRLYPLFFYKHLIKKFLRKENNFIFFIHPFEITGKYEFGGLKKLRIKDRIRFQLGRKHAEKKAKAIIEYLKRKGFTFCKFE